MTTEQPKPAPITQVVIVGDPPIGLITDVIHGGQYRDEPPSDAIVYVAVPARFAQVLRGWDVANQRVAILPVQDKALADGPPPQSPTPAQDGPGAVSG